MPAHDTPLWRLIEEHLDGRSWNSLGRDLGVTGAAVRSWATGRTRIKGYQADAIAGALGVSPDDVRAAAGLPLRRTPARAELVDKVAAAAGGSLDRFTDEQLAAILDAYLRAGGDTPEARRPRRGVA